MVRNFGLKPRETQPSNKPFWLRVWHFMTFGIFEKEK